MGCTINNKKLYLVTEFVPGGNLKQFIASTYALPNHTPEDSFPWRLRVSFAIDVARALVYLHAKKFIHRYVADFDDSLHHWITKMALCPSEI